MATLICNGNDLGSTILPYKLNKQLQLELFAHPSDDVLGYITYNQYTNERKFTYTESGGLIPAINHWSLNVMKEFPYCEQEGQWIVYKCSPERTRLSFNKILSKYSQTLHIYNWDTWSVVGKNSKVAVVTSWEIF
jgi:hypothetical protein